MQRIQRIQHQVKTTADILPADSGYRRVYTLSLDCRTGLTLCHSRFSVIYSFDIANLDYDDNKTRRKGGILNISRRDCFVCAPSSNNPVEGELESIPRLVLTTESFLFWKICARRGAISSYVRPLSPDGAKFQYLDWEIVRAFVHYYVTDSSMLCIIFGPLQRARGSMKYI